MDNHYNIETEGDVTSIVVETDKISLVNLLRRAILSEIETYAIDIVIFDINTSPRYDEVIALRLGQLVIDHTKLGMEGTDLKTHIDFSGPGEFTSDDIIGIPFKYKTPIATLLKDQRIKCDVIVKKGQGKTHVKWRPVSTVTITQVETGYRLAFKNIGMMPGDQIVNEGFSRMEDALHREPVNLFFSLVLDDI